MAREKGFRFVLACAVLSAWLLGAGAAAETERAELIEYAKVYLSPEAAASELGTLDPGVQVEVEGVYGTWAKIRYKMKTGYLAKSALAMTPAETGEAAGVTMLGRTLYVCEALEVDNSRGPLVLGEGDRVTLLGYNDQTADVLYKNRFGTVPLSILAADEELCYPLGAAGDSIQPLQRRLDDLGYFDGAATGVFDLETAMALIRFRMQLGLKDEFRMDSQTYDRLYAQDAPESLIRIARLQVGDTGSAVERMQKRLIAKGYLGTDVMGYYDGLTSQAVWLFQEAEGLTADGQAGPETLSRLFDPDAPALPAGKVPATEATTDALPGAVLLKDWFESDIQEIYAVDTVAKYTDLETGLSWYEMRRGGYNHADTQPLTAQDTAIFSMVVGGEWTWERRPVWVTIDGIRYAASINCMPHGQGSITGNNFNGHHCTHFLNSRTHGTDSLDERHQECVQIAAHTSYVTLNYNTEPVEPEAETP